MRRFAISVLLPLLMLLAQQGAAVHEIGHLHLPTAPSEQHGDSLAHDGLCLTCLAFAAIGSAAGTSAFQTPLLSFAPPMSATVAVAVLVAEALAPRSRGPPSLS